MEFLAVHALQPKLRQYVVLGWEIPPIEGGEEVDAHLVKRHGDAGGAAQSRLDTIDATMFLPPRLSCLTLAKEVVENVLWVGERGEEMVFP